MKKLYAFGVILTLLFSILNGVSYAQPKQMPSVQIATVEFKLDCGDVLTETILRNAVYFPDDSQNESLIKDYLYDIYYTQTNVIQILKIDNELIENTKYSEFAGEIPFSKKINSAAGSTGVFEKITDPIEKVTLDKDGNIDETVGVIKPGGKMDEAKKETTENTNVGVNVNGKPLEIDTKAYIKDGRTMVPFRAIFEALGAEVGYDFDNPNLKLVWGEKQGSRVDMQIGSMSAYKDGKEIYMDVAPEIVNSRTFIPVRYASELFGAKVEWDGKERKVIITTENE